MKNKLADFIVQNIYDNFSIKYISKNLVDTINISYNESGDFVIDIPAKIYDLALWQNKHVIVYTGQGSYANLVNKTGGFSRTHRDYIEIAIDKGISAWLEWFKNEYGNKNTEWKVTKK